jgi:hypothetical protein
MFKFNEKTVIDIFEKNPEHFRQALHELYTKTHIINPQEGPYEWCMVVTAKGKIKVYEQLNFMCELKGRSNFLHYEYEILGQEYVNILGEKDYTKEIIDHLMEIKCLYQFIEWLNSKGKQEKILNAEALRFKKAKNILHFLKQWDLNIHQEIKNHIYSLNNETDRVQWIEEKMYIIKSTVKCLRKEIKHSI